MRSSRGTLTARQSASLVMRARVIDQDPAHHLRRNAVEMRATLPDDSLLPDEPQYASWTSAVG